MSRYEDGLVSIVTPAWRAAGYVSDTIQGALAQTYTNWELLVVDDCSPDDTCAVVARAAAADPRVRLLRQSVNGGPANARNRALEEARGRFIAFCDSDDYWLPRKLELQLTFMQERSSAMSYTEFRRINESNSRIGARILVPESLGYHQLLKNTAIATSTVVLDRASIGDVRMTRTFYDDFVLWLSIMKRGFTAHGLREDLMRYRVVGNSWSRSKSRSAGMVWRTYREIEGLSWPYSAWCLANYGMRALVKYARR